MNRRPPSTTRPYTLFPVTTLFRSLLEHRRRDCGHLALVSVGPFAGGDLRGGVRGVLERIVIAIRLAYLDGTDFVADLDRRSEEHTSELQSLMRISYAVFC